MDLEEQLEQLQMMANQQNISSSTNSLKKIGPKIPPKPNKKPSSASAQDLPQVPKSCEIKKSCEPSYSTILQQNNYEAAVAAARRSLNNNTYSNMPQAQSMPVKKIPETINFYDQGATTHRMGSSASNNGEFVPGRIYENQKISINNVLKPVGDLPPPPPPLVASIPEQPANNHLYSNTPTLQKQHQHQHMDNKQHMGVKIGSGGSPQPPPAPTSHYSNISFENNQQNYRHPPPPLDVHYASKNMQSYQNDEEEFPPPPSPVSSSYSELRRATDSDHYPQIYSTTNVQHQNQFNPNMSNNNTRPNSVNNGGGVINIPGAGHYNPDYVSYGGMSSQASSTYESIYEPINPRPPSQMSTRSNYSLYTPYISDNNSHQSGGGVVGNSGKPMNMKEAEVDALTDMLVNSMDNIQDADSYGVCVKCDERIVGENSGCTAMDQIYHITCFTCYHCQINLQGKPFYALDGKPYCEEDYINTLEKCSVCVKPILDRILRATGKPYHPGCFTCVVCGKSLDGIPFTVDATNQIHCIEDFHKKFAPRCCVCRLPIMPEPGQEETRRVVALDRSFHIPCYKCEDCGLMLSSEAEGRGCYPLDDHVLCKSCNAKRVQMLTNHMTTEL